MRTEGESNAPNRTIYIGALHPQTSIADICDLIQDGPLDQVRILPNKNCAFVSFLEDQAGIAAHSRLSANPPSIYGKQVVVGWGSPRPLPEKIAQAVANGACRNVFIGGSVDRTSEEYLRDSLSRFGQIDCVDMLPAKKIAFVHFASITSAITCKEALQADPQWQTFRLNYGKDRCATDSKGRAHGEAKSAGNSAAPAARAGFSGGAYGGAAAFGGAAAGGYGAALSGFGAGFGSAANAAGFGAFAAPGAGLEDGNRTVYLGGVTEEYTLKDILDNVHGGILDQVKVLPEKKCCFISFVEPAAAQAFYARTSQNGFQVLDKTCKIGWGKSRPLPQAVYDALRKGASRNLFLGNIDPALTAEKLHADLGQFGQIEKLDILATKKIAFVHFTSILAAMRAADDLKTEGNPLHEAYATCRVNFGKDRCASEPSRGGGRGGSFRAKADYAAAPEQLYQAPQAFQQDLGYGYGDQGWAAQV
jgi:RNA recognition motif-containing protein